jgi:hypothetical protein
MSPLSKAVIGLGALWFHVGIGPLLGTGPMDVRQERPPRNGGRKLAAQPRQPAADNIFAQPKELRAEAVAERTHAA